MTKSLTLEKENIIKHTENLFRLKHGLNYTALKDVRNLFKLEKETKVTKDRKLTDIKNIFEFEEEGEIHFKLRRICNFWSNKLKNHHK